MPRRGNSAKGRRGVTRGSASSLPDQGRELQQQERAQQTSYGTTEQSQASGYSIREQPDSKSQKEKGDFVEQLAAKLEKQSISEKPPERAPEKRLIPVKKFMKFAPKQPPGKAGRPIKLVANYFEIEIPHGFVYHYDVDIVSVKGGMQQVASEKKYKCLNTLRNREIINCMVKTIDIFKGNFHAFDGQKNLIMRDALPKKIKPIPVKMTDSDREELYEVSIKPVEKKDTGECSINLEPLHQLFAGRTHDIALEAVMALEIILRQSPTMKFVPVGRSFFSASEELISLGGGREVWFGYHQSLQLTQRKPMLNIDMSATAFYESGPIIDFMCKILKLPKEQLRQIKQLQDRDIVLLSKELKGLRIAVTHLNYRRKYRIVRLTRDPASKLTFTMDVNGKQIPKTVASYFWEQYRVKLQYPNFPCLHVGSEKKQVFLPLEVCDIVEGQHCKKKLDENQTAEMIRHTARPPERRFQDIEKSVRMNNSTTDPTLKGFNIRINTQPLRLGGRVINPPSIGYYENDTIIPKEGSWNMQDKAFFRGADINTWVLLSFSSERFCNRQSLNRFSQMLCEVGTKCGIRIRKPALIEIYERNFNLIKIFTEMVSKYHADLAVIVISRFSNYSEIKQIAETKLNLMTQCIKDNNVVKKCNASLLTNLCQKINAKMGGINNALLADQKPTIFSKPVIIIGADVSHPAPGDKIKPSIAAVVGSLDAHPSRYAVSISVQAKNNELREREEIIVDLKRMVKEILKNFYKNTHGLKPERIIFYRDGVSEGQFEHVVKGELAKLKEACMEIENGYSPAITFIIVQKNHHTRFKPLDSRDGVGKMRNIPPGTTVDQFVTHPLNFDFFLCSHFGIQGTSRPAHYTVLLDENNFVADELQKLTYYLCHIYARCTRSISYPVPVTYAHLAAFRAKQYLISLTDQSSSGSDSSILNYVPAEIINAVKFHDFFKDKMFFV